MATLSQQGIPAAGFGTLQPKLSNRWQITFSNLAVLVPSTNSRNLTMQATDCSRPELEFEEVAIHRYNSTAYVAGKYQWQPMKITLEDDIGGLATSVIQGQLETQERLIGGDLPGAFLNTAATGSDYKFATTIDLLDGNEGIVEEWLVEGCWFKQVSYGDLNYQQSEAVKITLTVRFDHARQLIGAATGNSTSYGTALGGFIN